MQKTHSTAAVSAFAVRNSLVSDPGVLCFLKYLWACVKKTSPYGKGKHFRDFTDTDTNAEFCDLLKTQL